MPFPGRTARYRRAFRQAIGFTAFSAFQARAIDQVYACARQGNPRTNPSSSRAIPARARPRRSSSRSCSTSPATVPEVREQPGVRAVLVYPRIRLARNQLGRLLRYTGRFHAAGGPRITVGIQNGDVPPTWAHWPRSGPSRSARAGLASGGTAGRPAPNAPRAITGSLPTIPRLSRAARGWFATGADTWWTPCTSRSRADRQHGRHPDYHRCLAQPMAGAREVHANLWASGKGHIT